MTGFDAALRRGLRTGFGLAIGAVTAMVELGYLLCCGVLLLAVRVSPRAYRRIRAAVLSGAIRFAELERRRLSYFLRSENATDYGARRAVGYLSVRWLVGLLGGLVLLFLVFGLAGAGSMLFAWGFGFPWSMIEDGGRVTTATILVVTIPGAVLLYLDLAGIAGVAGLDRRLAKRFLGPSPTERMERRIAELSVSRADVVAAINDERRRIERDLHDGVQQRLVALGMLIGRARRGSDPERVAELLRAAHDESQRSLDDLRDVSWRVYPSALDDGGLAAALEMVADRSIVPVRLDLALPDRAPRAAETVAYFVVCEAVTNAAKHAGADLVRVYVAEQENMIVVRIEDNGKGGADPNGGGLSGLARRVHALDGRFAVHSPTGGPTTVTAELPCG